jgi:hypothetical protein
MLGVLTHQASQRGEKGVGQWMLPLSVQRGMAFLAADSYMFYKMELTAVPWQVLNAINKGGPEGKIRYFIRDPNKRDKAKERIAYAFEKIFILVRPFGFSAEQ